MRTPTQPPEAAIIETARLVAVPKMSIRRAAALAGMSDARWRQIAAGYSSAGRGLRVPVFAPADTLARMARVVGVGAHELRATGRDDAALLLEQREHDEATGDPVERFVRQHVPPGKQDAALAVLRALIHEDRPTTGDRKIG